MHFVGFVMSWLNSIIFIDVFLRTKFLHGQFCVAVFEMLHSTHGKKNLDTETEKSELELRFLYLTAKIPLLHGMVGWCDGPG